MNKNNLTVTEITDEAAHANCTANQLDILVSNTRQMNQKRDRVITRLHSVLSVVERRLAA